MRREFCGASATPFLFSLHSSAPLGLGGPRPPPNDPRRLGLHPKTPLGYGPRLGYLFSTSLRSGRKQIESRGKQPCQAREKGAYRLLTCYNAYGTEGNWLSTG